MVLPSLFRLAACLGACVWLTWPLATRLASALPDTYLSCRFDALYAVWALAWESRILVEAPQRWLEANSYHPTPHALAYGPMGIGALPLFAPVFLASGNAALAANVTILGGAALTAWGFAELVVRWTRSTPAAMVVALTYLTTPWVLSTWMPTAPFYAALWYLPWIILLAAGRLRRAWEPVVLAILVAAQGATDPIYVAPAVFAPLVVLAIARLVVRRTRAAGWRLSVALAIAALLLGPVVAAHWLVRAGDPHAAERTVWSRAVPPEAEALAARYRVAGVVQTPLEVPWWTRGNAGPLGVGHASLFLVAAGAVAALARRRRMPARLARTWRHGELWLAVGVLLSVPSVAVFDAGPYPSPVYLAATWAARDLVELFRWTQRLGAGALAGLCLLTGAGFATLAGRRASTRSVATWSAAGVVAVLLLLEPRPHVPPGPYPLHSAAAGDERLLEALRAGHGPLLELPVPDKGFLAPPQAEALYRSIQHRRPVLNGYSSYYPAGFAERMVLADRLPDAAALDALILETGLTQIVVRAGAAPVWGQLAAAGGDARLRLTARGTDWLLFDVRSATP